MGDGCRIWENLPRRKKAPGDTIVSFKYSKPCHLEEGLHLLNKDPGQI